MDLENLCPGGGKEDMYFRPFLHEFEPPPIETSGAKSFQTSFDRSFWHLMWDWSVLMGFAVFFGLGTAVVLRLKDTG